MSSVKTIPLAGAPPSTRFTLKIACSTTPARESIVAVTKSTASRARSKLLTLNSDISQLPSPRNRAMAGWSAGYQAARVKRQLTPGPISSLPGTAGSLPFISFSTSYRELDSAVRRPMLRIGKRREEYFAVAQAALLEAKHRQSRRKAAICLGNGETSGLSANLPLPDYGRVARDSPARVPELPKAGVPLVEPQRR